MTNRLDDVALNKTDFLVRDAVGAFRTVAWLEPYSDRTFDLHIALQRKLPVMTVVDPSGQEAEMNLYSVAQEAVVPNIAAGHPREDLVRQAQTKIAEMIQLANIEIRAGEEILEAGLVAGGEHRPQPVPVESLTGL